MEVNWAEHYQRLEEKKRLLADAILLERAVEVLERWPAWGQYVLIRQLAWKAEEMRSEAESD